LERKYEREQFVRYCLFYEEKEVALGWKWLNENTGISSRVAYAGRAEIYPLFGSKLKNNVFYVSVNDKPNIPHLYPNGEYRTGENFNSWLRNLRQEKVDFIFVYQLHDMLQFPTEEQWVRKHPEIFNLLFSNPKISIYSFSG